MTNNRNPVIGLTLDYETGGGYSKMPWYALRENYFASLSRHNALPVALPHDAGQADRYLDLIDGLVVTGGAFDVPPEMYGDSSKHEKTSLKQQRSAFEFAITQGALKRNMPILGICGGQQLLNVVLGGTLIQHIPDSVKDALAHEQPNPRTEPGHEIKVTEGTLLHKIVGTTRMAVNSAHHQAVAKVAPGAVVDAIASDGVIEGIEHPDYRFCLGVQWHPEYSVDSGDEKIFSAFIRACQK